ncbi:MAG: T9SS type A sorting domain-containing protein [Bacteroidota bacterium]
MKNTYTGYHFFFVILFCLLLNALPAQTNSFWRPLGNGLYPNTGWALYGDSVTQSLYVGGNFHNGKPPIYETISLMRWYEGRWDTLVRTTSSEYVRSITRYRDKLYVGGVFNNFNGLGIAEPLVSYKEGEGWQATGVGFNGYVLGLKPSKNELMVGGSFTHVNHVFTRGAARFDGQTWQAIGDGASFPGPLPWNGHGVSHIVPYDGKIFMGGNSLGRHPNDVSIDLAYFENGTWYPDSVLYPGGSLTSVLDMEIFQGDLYIAGNFQEAWGDTANGILKYDGQQWHELGTGVIGIIRDMEVHQGELWVSGAIFEVDGVPAGGIAKWDGERWCVPSESIFDNIIMQMESWNDTLYILGGFWTISGDSIRCVAAWTGSDSVAGCGPQRFISTDVEPASQYLFRPKWTVYQDMLYITGVDPVSYPLEMRITDIQGRVVLKDKYEYPRSVSIGHLPSGVYIVQLKNRLGQSMHKKLKIFH